MKNPVTCTGFFIYMARLERFERPTAWFVARYSIQLSYRRIGRAVLSRNSFKKQAMSGKKYGAFYGLRQVLDSRQVQSAPVSDQFVHAYQQVTNVKGFIDNRPYQIFHVVGVFAVPPLTADELDFNFRVVLADDAG